MTSKKAEYAFISEGRQVVFFLRVNRDTYPWWRRLFMVVGFPLRIVQFILTGELLVGQVKIGRRGRFGS